MHLKLGKTEIDEAIVQYLARRSMKVLGDMVPYWDGSEADIDYVEVEVEFSLPVTEQKPDGAYAYPRGD